MFRSLRKPLAAVALIAVLGLSLFACGGKTPPQILPPTAGSIPPTVDNNIVIVLGALETAAIALAPVDGIPAADTNAVIDGVNAAIKIVEAAQTGWVSAMDEAFSTIEPKLSPATQATLGPWLNAVYAAIGALYANGLS